ncbi:hypothetical protein GCM10028857_00580 [Salinarchaeum chitinilyticum]
MSGLFDRHAPYVAPLVLGRLADTATTLYGLTIAGIYERNPLVAGLIDALGPGVGMLLANLVSVAVIVAAVETGLAIADPVRDTVDWRVEKHLFDIGYLPAVAVSFFAAIHNLGVIALA